MKDEEWWLTGDGDVQMAGRSAIIHRSSIITQRLYPTAFLAAAASFLIR
jgi:hypothetical protein